MCVLGTYLSELEPLDTSISVWQNKKPENKDTSIFQPPTAKTSEKTSGLLHNPNSIVFVRRRMLYARPAINSQGGVRFGLRHIRKSLALPVRLLRESLSMRLLV